MILWAGHVLLFLWKGNFQVSTTSQEWGKMIHVFAWATSHQLCVCVWPPEAGVQDSEDKNSSPGYSTSIMMFSSRVMIGLIILLWLVPFWMNGHSFILLSSRLLYRREGISREWIALFEMIALHSIIEFDFAWGLSVLSSIVSWHNCQELYTRGYAWSLNKRYETLPQGRSHQYGWSGFNQTTFQDNNYISVKWWRDRQAGWQPHSHSWQSRDRWQQIVWKRHFLVFKAWRCHETPSW